MPALSKRKIIGNDSIQESILFCQELQARSTGAEIFDATENFFEEEMLQWKNCVSVCTDDAAVMIGKNKGFVSKVKQKNSDVQITHCFLHREALMAKTLPDDLKKVLDTKLVNFIKASPLKTRLFEILCKEMGAEHTGLLLHTEVR